MAFPSLNFPCYLNIVALFLLVRVVEHFLGVGRIPLFFLLVLLLFRSVSERAGALTLCMLGLHIIVVFPAKTGTLLTGSSSGARGVELGALLATRARDPTCSLLSPPESRWMHRSQSHRTKAELTLHIRLPVFAWDLKQIIKNVPSQPVLALPTPSK